MGKGFVDKAWHPATDRCVSHTHTHNTHTQHTHTQHTPHDAFLEHSPNRSHMHTHVCLHHYRELVLREANIAATNPMHVCTPPPKGAPQGRRHHRPTDARPSLFLCLCLLAFSMSQVMVRGHDEQPLTSPAAGGVPAALLHCLIFTHLPPTSPAAPLSWDGMAARGRRFFDRRRPIPLHLGNQRWCVPTQFLLITICKLRRNDVFPRQASHPTSRRHALRSGSKT
jgi:hypothetical protein